MGTHAGGEGGWGEESCGVEMVHLAHRVPCREEGRMGRESKKGLKEGGSAEGEWRGRL